MRALTAFFLFAARAIAQPAALAVDIDSVVHPITVQKVRHAIQRAEAGRAPFLLIRLNTPGGMMTATSELTEQICRTTVPVVTFVTPVGGRAASAGFFLLLAGDVAAMTAGTHTGAATPVLMGQEMDAVMRRKVENDAAASIRTLAARRNRNQEKAEAAVLQAKSYTSEEALSFKLIDLVVPNEAALLAKLDGRLVTRCDGSLQTIRTAGAQLTNYQPTFRERIISPLADPNLAFVILILGGLLLYVEFNTPGAIAPGVFGAILVVVALMALSVLPINGAGIALLFLAITLFVLEAKITSHGILGLGGVLAMIFGAVLLIDGPPEMKIRWTTAIAVAIPFAAITVFLVTLALKAWRSPPATGSSVLLTETGIAETDLTPSGTIRIHGELWSASASAPLARGTPVRVIAINGLNLQVVPTPTPSRKD